MAGNNQHHVWQLLQRGFGEKRGKGHWPVVYHRDRVSNDSSTAKIGSADRFYNNGPDASADVMLTDFEASIQREIQKLRLLDNGTPVDTEFADNFVTHLEMRSLFLREELSRIGELLIEGLMDVFNSKTKARLLLESYFEHNPNKIK